MEPGFLLSYWRPWDENSSFVDSWGNYLRDTSLVDYGVNKIGEHIKSAASALGFEISKVSEQLEFLNWRTQVLIEQQKLSNLLLNNVAELLKIPDYEKERIQEITLGIKFFSNASKNPKFFIDSLEHFLKAEELMSQDYFVLFHIGCIYLYSPNLLNLEKATDYFLRAGEYAEVECDPSAVRLSNQLTNRVNNKYTEQTSRTESIKLLTSDIYKNTALCYYILGKDCSAIDYQMKATKFCNSPENKVLLAKYLIRNSQINESLKYLEAAVNETPELLGAVICDADIAGERQVIDFAHKKNHEIELSVEDCATEALIRGDKTAFLNIIAAAQGSYIEQVAAVNEGLRVYHSVQKRIEIDWGEYKSKDGLVAYRGQSIFGGAINSDYYRISLRVFFPRNNDAYEIKLIARFWQNDDYAPQSVITPARLFIKTEDGTNKQLESVQLDKGYSYLDKKKVTSFRFPVEEEVLLSLYQKKYTLFVEYDDNKIYPLHLESDDSLSFIKLKEKYVPGTLTDVQKRILKQLRTNQMKNQFGEDVKEFAKVLWSDLHSPENRDRNLYFIGRPYKNDAYYLYYNGDPLVLLKKIGYKSEDYDNLMEQLSLLRQRGLLLGDGEQWNTTVKPSDAFINYSLQEVYDVIDQKTSISEIKKKTVNQHTPPQSSSSTNNGCYIATCVYGSYDCPEVWTLRRYRDQVLKKSWFGRLFIKVYYSISPSLVCLWGDKRFFRLFGRNTLTRLVHRLNKKGIESSPYIDAY